jgi:hypothetical protein
MVISHTYILSYPCITSFPLNTVKNHRLRAVEVCGRQQRVDSVLEPGDSIQTAHDELTYEGGFWRKISRKNLKISKEYQSTA